MFSDRCLTGERPRVIPLGDVSPKAIPRPPRGVYGLLRLLGATRSDPEVQNYVEWLAMRSARERRAARAGLALAIVRRLLRTRSRLRAAGRRVVSLRPAGGMTASKVRPVERRWSAPPYLFEPDDAIRLGAEARRRFPSDVDALVSFAERIRRGIFPLLSGCAVDRSAGWRPRLVDREQIFYLNRCRWAPVLARAAIYTGEKSYVETLIHLLEDWGRENPVGESETWESYSVAERICNWTQVAYLLRALGGYEGFLADWLLPQLSRHATFLSRHLETALMHNHLINNGRALFIFGVCFPEACGAVAARELGWKILAGEMPRQTRPDGIFREQSAHYHLLLTRTFTEAVWLAHRQHLVVPDTMLQLLERMHEAASAMLRPDGSLPLVGDICPDVEVRSLAGILAVGAVLFGRPDLKRIEAVNESAVWMLGTDGLAAWDELAGGPPERTVVAFPSGGFAILGRRSGTSVHATLHADPAGAVLFHGDVDPLGLSLWWTGREIVVDTGNLSYSRDRWWAYFKSAAAQSTIIVDGLLPWPAAAHRLWFGPRYGAVDAGVTAGTTPSGEAFAEAWHTGYARLPDPVTLRRRVVLREGGVTIVDDLCGQKTHGAEILFHLGPGRALRSDQSVDLVDADGRIVAAFRPQSAADMAVSIVDGWVATEYGVKRPGHVVRISIRDQFPLTVQTEIEFGCESSHVREMAAS